MSPSEVEDMLTDLIQHAAVTIPSNNLSRKRQVAS